MRLNRFCQTVILLAVWAGSDHLLAQNQNKTLTHCKPDERVQFSCRVGVKIVSLCGGGVVGPLTALTYRYGVVGKIEKEYSARPDNANRFFVTVGPVNPQASVEQIWFDYSNVRYLMTACTGGSCPQHAGLAVLRRNRVIMNTPCVRFAKDDFGGFSPELGTFTSQAATSQSSTVMLITEDMGGNELDKLFPNRGPRW